MLTVSTPSATPRTAPHGGSRCRCGPARGVFDRTFFGFFSRAALPFACPAGRPLTPLGRLDAADKRLNTLLYAVVTLRAPVDGFFASLSDAQKTRLSGLSR